MRGILSVIGQVLGKFVLDNGLFSGFKEVKRSTSERINKCWLEYLNWGTSKAATTSDLCNWAFSLLPKLF